MKISLATSAATTGDFSLVTIGRTRDATAAQPNVSCPVPGILHSSRPSSPYAYRAGLTASDCRTTAPLDSRASLDSGRSNFAPTSGFHGLSSGDVGPTFASFGTPEVNDALHVTSGHPRPSPRGGTAQ
ncbi:MAG: hypothetical protein ACJAR2_003186, partial [Ilumatobacter sp.]